MDWFKRLRMKLKFVSFINDPTRTNVIFEIINIATSLKSNQKSIQQIEERLLGENKEFKEMWESSWNPKTPSLRDLANYPSDSLGQAYYRHLKNNGLDVVFFPKVKIDRPIDYISYRMYHSHDLWHTLLDYDTSPAGEIEVQAFGFGQLGSPVAAMLISGGILNLLENSPEVVPEVFERAYSAFQRGKSTPFLLSYPLEEMLSHPIEKVRSQVFNEALLEPN